MVDPFIIDLSPCLWDEISADGRSSGINAPIKILGGGALSKPDPWERSLVSNCNKCPVFAREWGSGAIHIH